MKKIFTNYREILLNHADVILKKDHFKFFLYCTLKGFFTIYHISGDSHEFEFVNLLERKDHKALFDDIYEQCPYDKGFISWEEKRGVNWRCILDYCRFFLIWKNSEKFLFRKTQL